MVQDISSNYVRFWSRVLFWKLTSCILNYFVFCQARNWEQQVKWEVSISGLTRWDTLINGKPTHFLLLLVTITLHAHMQTFKKIFFRNAYISGNNLHGIRNYLEIIFYNFNTSLKALFTIHLFTESLVHMKEYKPFTYRSIFCFIDCTTT